MEGLASLPIGLAAALLGSALLALAWLASRWAGGRRFAATQPPAPPVPAQLAGRDDGVVMARVGGRILFANQPARKWFGLNGGEPDLMVMAQQAKPQEAFLELFAAEGHAELEIGGRRVEASSHRLPQGVDAQAEARIVVVLREAAKLPELTPGDERSARVIAALTEITRVISASLDLDTTLDAVLEGVRRIVDYDIGEITLWEAQAGDSPERPEGVLRPRGRAGDQAYILALERMGGVYRLDEGYSGWLARNRRPLLIPDVERRLDVRPKVDLRDFPFRSYVGVPLLFGQRLIGTLELVSYQQDAFGERDLALLETIAGQAAVAINNARLFADQQRRLEELTGLAAVAQAAAALSDPKEVYAQLTERIAKLMGVELCGFLLYSQAEQALVSQPPFYGVPEAFIEYYRLPLAEGGPANRAFKARLWQEGDYWYTNNVADDPLVKEMGLLDLAQAIGVRNTLLAPLTSGGRRLGVVQVSNKPGDFDESDVRLLTILTGQAAAIIDNARLVREEQVRAARAEGLRRIGAIAGSAAPLDDIMGRAMQVIGTLAAMDYGIVLLLDEAAGELAPVPGSAFGGSAEEALHARLRTDHPLFRFAVVRTKRPFRSNRAQRDRRILEFYKPLVDYFQVNSVIDVPLVVGDQGIGELIVGARAEGAYSRSDVQLLSTVATQLAGAVARARLAAATDQTLRRRVDQLSALTGISRALNQTLVLQTILDLVHQEAVRVTGADCGSLLLLDLDTTAGGVAIRVGDALEAGSERVSSVEAVAVATGESRVIDDFEAEGEQPMHPGVRSALLVPIAYEQTPVGLIHVHSGRPAAFDAEARDFVQALAAQAAIAIGNARRYEEQFRRGELIRRRADQLQQLFEISSAVRSDRPVAENLDAIALSVQTAAGFNVVLISVINPATGHLERTAAAGLSLAAFQQMKQVTQPWELLQPFLRDEFRLSRSYFIPHDKSADFYQTLDVHTPMAGRQPTTPAGQAAPPQDAHRWRPEDILLVPLYGSRGEVLGLMSVDDPSDGLRPNRAAVETLEIFANQAALAIENARLFQAAQERAAESLERAAQLEALIEVSRVISSALRSEDVISLMLDQLGRLIPYDSVTFWQTEPEAQRLRVVAARGFENDAERIGLSVEVSDSALFSEMASSRSVIIVPDVRDDPRFPAGAWRTVRSWMGVPMVSKGEIVGLLALDKAEADYYQPAHIPLSLAFANQAAVALDNARLFEESYQSAAQLRERTQRLVLLNRVSAELVSTLQLEKVLNIALRELSGALQAEHASAYILDSARGLAFRLATFPEMPAGGPGRDAAGQPSLPLESNAHLARLRETVAPATVEDVTADVLARPGHAAWFGPGAKSALLLPLATAGQLIGLLVLSEATARRRFTAGEMELAMTIVNQAAVAVQNARLYDETQQRLIELATINQIGRAISSAIDMTTLMDTIRMQVGAVLNTESLYLATYTEAAGAPTGDAQAESHYRGELSFPLRVVNGGLIETEPERPAGLNRWIIESQQPLLVADVAASEWAGQSAARSFLGVPLILGERVRGVLAVEDYVRPNAFDQSHLRILSTISTQIAVAIENARLYEQTRRFTQELEVRVHERTEDLARERDRVEILLKITSELSASLDLDRVLSHALLLVNDVLGAEHGSIYLADPQSDGLILRATLDGGAEPDHVAVAGMPAPFRSGEGLVGWAIRKREAVIVPDLSVDERWAAQPLPGGGVYRSALVAPLIASEDSLGALVFLSPRPEAFSAAHLRLVSAAANQVASAINNAELYRMIRDQAERLGGLLHGQQVEATKSRAILEGVADGVMVADSAGRVILFNAAAERILNLSREAVLEEPVADFVGIYGAAGRAWAEAMQRWTVDPSSYQPGDYLAERLELDDQRVVSVHLAPVVSGDDFLGTVSVFRDITREVEVDRLKSEFVATVSHELRTPMTSIKGYADLLLAGAAGGISEDQARFLEVIKSNADRLTMLVNDLLDISRIESGKVKLDLQPLDIAMIIGNVMAALRGRVQDEGKPMRLMAEVQPDLPPVLGDVNRVTQILTNLADNAFNYTPADGAITISASQVGGALQVNVSDTGIGIPPEEQKRIFDRFYRGEHPLVLASAGTGLGLNIVRHLVEMHGGQLWFESEGVRGKGSTFSFLLPLAAEPAPETAGAERAAP